MDNIITRLIRPEIAQKTWFFPAEKLELSVVDLLEKIKYYAAIMQQAGVKKGECIGFVNSNSSDLVCLLYACWTINAVAVPLRTQTGKFQRLQDYIKQCDDVCHFKLLIHDDAIKFDQPAQHILNSQSSIHSLSSFISTTTNAVVQPAHIDPDDIAIIQFSSGSTGKPKGIIVNHGMMMVQLANIEQQVIRPLADKKATCYALWAPLNHDMGLFVGVLSPIHHGSDNILAPPSFFIRNPMRWLTMMAEHKVEVAMFTNAALARCLPIIERKTQDSSLDLSRCHIYLGAEKVSPKVLKAAYRVLEPLFGNRDNLYIGYGMAENALGVSTTLPGEIPVIRASINADNSIKVLPQKSASGIQFASVGIPYPDNIVTIRNDFDEILPELVLGEINVESDSLTPGYLNNLKATQNAFQNNRFKTADLGFWYNGQLYFHSRKDDLIISNGQNIVPDDIELLIEELNFVRASSSVLFSIEDKKTGLQKLILLVESSTNISAENILNNKNRIVKHAYSELGMVLNHVYFCTKASIEKTSSGKKRRKVIRQRFMDNQVEIISGKEKLRV